MQLSDIRKSILESSDEELRAMLIEIRQSRRTSKRPTPTVRSAKAKPEASIEAIMGAMTQEQIEMLLKKMGG